MKKDVTFEDLYNLLKIKNNTISFLRQRLEPHKSSSGLVEPLIDTKPQMSLSSPVIGASSFGNSSPISSPKTLLPGSPGNPFEYNPFVRNVWK